MGRVGLGFGCQSPVLNLGGLAEVCPSSALRPIKYCAPYPIEQKARINEKSRGL